MTKTKTTPPVMSPAWCAGIEHAASTTINAARRDNSEASAKAGRILSAANMAGNQTAQEGLKRTWTGESALRVWGRASDELRELIAPLPQGRLRMYPPKELHTLARLPMQFLEVASRLYAEVAPAIVPGAKPGDRGDAIAMIKLQEFLLNYVITPAVIDAHKALDCTLQDTFQSEQSEVSHDAQLSIVKQVAGFAAALCKLADEYAPDSNPYAGLVADEFTAGCEKVNRVLELVGN